MLNAINVHVRLDVVNIIYAVHVHVGLLPQPHVTAQTILKRNAAGHHDLVLVPGLQPVIADHGQGL